MNQADSVNTLSRHELPHPYMRAEYGHALKQYPNQTAWGRNERILMSFPPSPATKPLNRSDLGHQLVDAVPSLVWTTAPFSNRVANENATSS